MALLVGTASWTDKTLIACGRFYPREARSAEARLRHYASVFPMVELDSSYYAMPSAANAALWVERTPPGFVFDVKAFRLFTGHQTAPQVLHADLRRALEDAGIAERANPGKPIYYRDVPGEIRAELWRRFKEALWPLRAAGKLGAVLFQFPPWLMRNAAGHQHVAHCAEQMDDYLLSVEFRHRSWLSPEHQAATLAFERELGVAHVIVDAPQGFANSVPAVWAVTEPRLATLRLHGRNAATWNIRGATAASERFNYDYPTPELQQFVPPLRRLAQQVENLHVVFNNNYEDQGQRNAATLRALLEAAAGTALAPAGPG